MDIGLPLKWVRRGVFLPITKTINSSIFRLISVTHEQDSMPVKYNAFFKYKLHPSVPAPAAPPGDVEAALVSDHGGQIAHVVHVGHQGPGVGSWVITLHTAEPPLVIIIAASNVEETIELSHRGSLSLDIHLWHLLRY